MDVLQEKQIHTLYHDQVMYFLKVNNPKMNKNQLNVVQQILIIIKFSLSIDTKFNRF